MMHFYQEPAENNLVMGTYASDNITLAEDPAPVPEKFMNVARTSELWVAVKTALALKADKSELGDYTTADDVAAAIVAALAEYATDADVTKEITKALADYLTETEVREAIAQAVVDASGMSMQVVDTLPTTGMEKVIYLVPSATAGTNNVKDEYLWIDGKWELVGSTAVNLSGYWAKEELRAITQEELEAILV